VIMCAFLQRKLPWPGRQPVADRASLCSFKAPASVQLLVWLALWLAACSADVTAEEFSLTASRLKISRECSVSSILRFSVRFASGGADGEQETAAKVLSVVHFSLEHGSCMCISIS